MMFHASIDRCVELLKQKQQLDNQDKQANHMVDYSGWLADAMEYLLREHLDAKEDRPVR
jgi:hypothetical protein